ncbi:peroxiredoxin [Couchioplanes caeruleus]|uniref:thioredoxin-dependent peroxiredoxin n=2 Tax=Couchioplanes caeruleus TaxID=56438 RepID=A0A1K0FMI2_9ACTN|nr:peroxiredoxin [Couchioplanes caeruleus]OJF13936.1 peroxiredoxin [Couchioplanes caeruleus subsp. caeruleus]ROP34366.1 peroxiredoxin Q/BCP [Couchioplanes caeruleus]
MTIDKGDFAPDFALPDQDGTTLRLSELLASGPVVLFFYPAAMTSGCTVEACNFRDLAAEFAAAGVQRVGISRDAVAKQKQFADLHNFDYPLLSDADSAVAAAYGVKRRLPLGPLSIKRMTFVIDTDRTVLDVIHSELDMNAHGDRALEVLRARSARDVA